MASPMKAEVVDEVPLDDDDEVLERENQRGIAEPRQDGGAASSKVDYAAKPTSALATAST